MDFTYPMGYIRVWPKSDPSTSSSTIVFREWLLVLRDDKARARINMGVRRFEMGNPGDVAPVGGGVSEMRIDCGPGYRVYYIGRGSTGAILLCGGDKSTQDRDVERAKAMAGEK